MAMKGKKQRPEKHNDHETGRLKRKDYEKQLERLHVELVKAQQWIVHKGLKVCAMVPARAVPSKRSPSA
jgi:polyphosphate kinase